MNLIVPPKKILCAICASLTAVSKGVEFGFTSQLTYSLKHGYQKMRVTDVDLSWIGWYKVDHYILPTKVKYPTFCPLLPTPANFLK